MISKDDEQRLIDRLVQHDTASHGNLQLPESGKKEFDEVRQILDKINRIAEGTVFPSAETVEQQEETPSLGSASPQAEYLPKTIGRFRIKQQVGMGGFGIVFHAFDPKLNRDVALKILRPECLLIEANRLRFEREAQVAATLNHPAIVPVFETGFDGPIRFIVFGFVPGQNLAQWLSQQNNVLDCDNAAKLTARLADAVASAHRCGILHRDLKPSNVLIETFAEESLEANDLESNIRIADFGLAIDTAKSSRITGTGALLGTPVYNAPELLTEDSLASTSSDVYSLGVILYELLAGKPPFEADSNLKLLRSIHANQPPRFSTIRHPTAPTRLRVPRDLEAICFKCLHKEPELRYRSAVELHADLNRYLKGEPVRARPITVLSQTLRWAQTNPLVSGLLSAVAVLTLVVAVGAAWANLELTNKNTHLSALYFDSLVDRSRLTRQSLRSGRKKNSLKAINDAVGMLSASDERALQLRNEVVATLGLHDLEVAKSFDVPHSVTASELHRIAFNSQLSHVAFESDQSVFVMNLVNGRIEQTMKLGGSIESLFFGKDQQLFLLTRENNALASKPHLLRVWNLQTDDIKELVRCEHSVRAKLTADGNIAICARNFQLLSSEDGATLKECRIGNEPVDGFELSPTEKWLATWHGNQIKVWRFDGQEFDDKPNYVFEHAFNPLLNITAVGWTANETQLAACTSVHSTHVWSLEWGESRHREFAGHEGWVYQAIFSRNYPHLTTSSSDGLSRVWNYETGELLMICDGIVVADCESSDDLAGIQDGKVSIWKQRPNEAQRLWRKEDCPFPITGNLGISNESAAHVLVSNSEQLLLFDGNSQALKLHIDQPESSDVAFSGDGRFAFWAMKNELLRLDCNTGERQVVLKKDDELDIEFDSLSASHDGKHLAFANAESQIVFDCEFGRIRSETKRIAGRGFCRYSPAAPIIAVPRPGGILIENYETGEQHQLFDNLNQPLCFTPDGNCVLAQTEDRLSLASMVTGKVASEIRVPNECWSHQVAFSQNGDLLAVAGANEDIALYKVDAHHLQHVLDLPAGRPQRNWVAIYRNKILCADSEVYVVEYDLDKIRHVLKEMNLDW